MAGEIKCNACGCAFVPEVATERYEDIEFTLFRCDFCGKAYIITVTDSVLRENIQRYAEIAAHGREKALTDDEIRNARKILEENMARAHALRAVCLEEDRHGGE